MAKDPFRGGKSDRTGVGPNDDAWAKNIKQYRDPFGRKPNSVGDYRPESEVRPRPVGVPANKPGDSQA
jgi:hypothetical protein